MKVVLKAALDRQTEAWRVSRGTLPQVPWDPDVDPSIYCGTKDTESWIGWEPIEKHDGRSLAQLAPDLGPFHPSIECYFADYWFLALEGKFSELMLTLSPNRPGLDPEQYLDLIRRSAVGSDRLLEYVPIGIDNQSSLTVVVGNQDGRVFLDDWEVSKRKEIASSLEDLLNRLVV